MRKIFTTAILMSVIIFCPLIPAYSWTEYKNVRYMDLDGDSTNEIIIEAKHGAGSNHYIEDMRIFKDNYPELDLIFSIRTVDSTYGFKPASPYNCDIISAAQFTEQTPENNGIRNIIVTSKKISYKDEGNKVIDKEEDLGTKIFRWNGKAFIESQK